MTEPRRKLAREQKLANPRLKAKQERRAKRERLTAAKIAAMTLPAKAYGVIYADPEWRDEVWSRETGARSRGRQPLRDQRSRKDLGA